MARSFVRWLSAGALLVVLGAASPLHAHYGSVEDIWDRFINTVGSRDEVETLACYHEKLRNQLSGDKTAAGRARLSVHMAEMFELLGKDYDYLVIEQKEDGDRASYTIKFKHRKKHNEHQSSVSFLYENGRWFITQAPELPKFLSAGSGTITMVAGVVIALIALGLLAKKALG